MRRTLPSMPDKMPAKNVRELLIDSASELLALLQRPSSRTGTFDVAPDQFVRVQLGGVARQEMQAQPSFGGFDVVANDTSLVCGKAVEDQTHGFLAPMHQLPEQFDEQFAVQTALVGANPKLPARTDCRSGGNRLTLPRSVHDRSLAAQPPGLSMHCVGAKARFIPKQNLCAIAFGLACQRRMGLLLPQGNCLGISLIRTLQRLLLSQIVPTIALHFTIS